MFLHRILPTSAGGATRPRHFFRSGLECWLAGADQIAPGATREAIQNGYAVLFDDRTRAAHLAALIDARCNEPSRWPTVAIVRKIARLFEVPAAELGAFFGLLCQPGAKGEVSPYAV